MRLAALYWDAFGQKLGAVLGPDAKGQAFLADCLDPDFALIARDANGQILGLAGFKTAQGALIAGDWPQISQHYGLVGAAWRIPLLAFVERDVAKGILLMDGICVTAQARGRGVGSALLEAIKEEARTRHCQSVRLDVVDSNPRAKALYERSGFVATQTRQLGLMRHVFGFRASQTMLCNIPA